MPDSRVVLAAHTPDFALRLVNLLNARGIDADIESCDVADYKNDTVVCVTVRVRDLRKALELTENPDIYFRTFESVSAGKGRNVLIPVDFSPFSLTAVKVGFQFAERLSSRPVLLHAYPDPAFSDEVLSNYDDIISQENMEEDRFRFEKSASLAMKAFRAKIEENIIYGLIPDRKFSSALSEGIPEEVILDSARISPPAIIVMATRGIHKKAADVIGSVTAEVMDSCRNPIFTVPENYSLDTIDGIRNIAFVCSLSGRDVMAMSVFNSFFPACDCNITLIPVQEKGNVKGRVDSLKSVLKNSFPHINFDSRIFRPEELRSGFENFYHEAGIQLIIAPNRKRNIFTRLFNPGIAHRILFEKDVPMLVVPV